MKFEINKKNIEKLDEWLQKHTPDCSYWQAESLIRTSHEGTITYAFTPTSAGLRTEAQCRCGQKTDITEYE